MNLLDQGSSIQVVDLLPLQERAAAGLVWGPTIDRRAGPRFRSALLMIEAETKGTITDLDVTLELHHATTNADVSYSAAPGVTIPNLTLANDRMLIPIKLDGHDKYHRLRFEVATIAGETEVAITAKLIFMPEDLPAEH